MNRQVILAPHNSNWKRQFETEAELLQPIFGDNLLTIHHIGSTAISSIQAKPIIDMMPVVWDIEQVECLTEAMAQAGYIYKGENGIPGRRYFRKGSDLHHSHHIHVFQTGRPEIAHHLLFRDYLRAHGKKARAYDQLKADLARMYRDDTAAYTSAKSAFIQRTIQEALGWLREGQRPLHTLTTSRLQIIALSLAQLQSFYQDPSLLAAALNLPLEDNITHPIVRQATRTKISKMRLAEPKLHHWFTYWLIVRRDVNLAVGTIGFKGEPDLSGSVEIGYGLAPTHREKGFMTEAAQAVTTWAFSQPNCITVFAATDPNNVPSHRVLQKIGMERAGELDGEWRWEMKVER